MAYKYSGAIKIRATYDDTEVESLYDSLVAHIGQIDTNNIIKDIEAHIEGELEHVTPPINTESMRYETSSDMIIEIFSNELSRDVITITEYTNENLPGYKINFETPEFTEQPKNQQGGRRRHKSRSRRAKKTAKRNVHRKCKTHRKRNSRK